MKKTLFFSLSVTGAQQRPWTGRSAKKMYDVHF